MFSEGYHEVAERCLRCVREWVREVDEREEVEGKGRVGSVDVKEVKGEIC